MLLYTIYEGGSFTPTLWVQRLHLFACCSPLGRQGALQPSAAASNRTLFRIMQQVRMGASLRRKLMTLFCSINKNLPMMLLMT